MNAEILRLRCLRCGDWHEREVGDWHLTELCMLCVDKGLEVLFGLGSAAYLRWCDRWSRAPSNHPTRVALGAAGEQWLAAHQPNWEAVGAWH